MMKATGSSVYTYSGSLVRSSSMLQPSIVNFAAFPDRATSSNLQTWRSNVILTFKLDRHILFPYHTNGARIIITESASLLSLSATPKSCTAIVTDIASPAY